MAVRQEPEREVESVWRLGPPDPSTLTTAQLLRELTSLKELFTTRIDAVEKAQEKFEENMLRVPTEVDRGVKTLRELLESKLGAETQARTAEHTVTQTRFDAMDRANELFQENIARVPTKVQESVYHQGALMDEKFLKVQTQFDLLDRSTKEKAELADKALIAALSAQKETAQKTETALTKLIDQQATTVQTLGNTLNDKLNDLKGAQSITEGKSGGQTAVWGWVVGVVGLLLTLLGVVAVVGVSLFEAKGK
jgi:hypothetical protein